MNRKTRFSDGGLNPYQGDDVDPFSAVRNEDGGTAPKIDTGMSEAEPGWESKTAPAPAPAASPAPKSFKQAFAEAKDGSTFTWNGKSYKKEFASSGAKAAPKPPTAGRGTASGPTAEDMSKAEARRTSIYNLDRDPLVQKIKAATAGPTAAQREAKAEVERESRRGAKPKADTYYGKTAEERAKAMRGYAKGGEVRGWGQARGARKAKNY